LLGLERTTRALLVGGRCVVLAQSITLGRARAFLSDRYGDRQSFSGFGWA
jgi:hypothetical protein